MTDAHTPTSAEVEADLKSRWVPTAEQVAEAKALLATVPEGSRERYYAVVGLAQPGKEYGFWVYGQEVVAVPGVWLGENTTGPSEHPFTVAKQAAEEAAAAWLREHGRSGTVATAMIGADGTAAVFEGFGSIGG